MEIILKHFPDLSDHQIYQFEQLWALYHEWNSMINVISRKDIDNLYEHHVLHSLCIAKYIHFKDGSDIFDLGTGGGFPAIPLAIYFPQVKFVAADGTKKKIKVVDAVSEAIGLNNLKAIQQRAEEHRSKYDFVVTRAVAKVDKLKMWSEHLIHLNRQNHTLPNGIIALKGGDIRQESNLLSNKDYFEILAAQKLINEPFFEEKYVFYLQR